MKEKKIKALLLIMVIFLSVSSIASPMGEPQFLDQMSTHHREAIKMAKIGAKKASDKKIRSLAETMVKEQEKEVNQIEEWRKNKFSSTPMSKERSKDLKIHRLESSTGTKFDSKFTTMMSEHHKQGIKIIDDYMPMLKDKEIMNFAHNISENQKVEISKLNHLHSMSRNGADPEGTGTN